MTSPAGPTRRLALDVLEGVFAVCRLPADAAVPEWAWSSGVLSAVVRTPHEMSIVAVSSDVPAGVLAESDYRVLCTRGPLPLDLVGILASMATPLAEAGVSIFALSTFNTDYVLVKQLDLERAVQALRAAGHQVSPYP